MVPGRCQPVDKWLIDVDSRKAKRLLGHGTASTIFLASIPLPVTSGQWAHSGLRPPQSS